MTTTDAELPTMTLPIPAEPATTPSDTPGVDSLPTGKAPRRPRVRRTRPSSDRTPKPRATTPRSKAPKIGEGMAGLYVMIGLGLAVIPSAPAKGDGLPVPVTMAIGSSLVAQAEECGAAWEKLAAENPQVKAALEKILTVSVFSALIAAHLPVLVTAGTVTGVVPSGLAAMFNQQTAA